MSAKTGLSLLLVLVCLGLFPTAAAAQGAVGPLQGYSSNNQVISSAKAGSLAFFATSAPPDPYSAVMIDLMRSDGTSQGTFSVIPPGPFKNHAVTQFADSLGGLIFFSCMQYPPSDPEEDPGLWRSDGTVAGTFPVTHGLRLGMNSSVVERPLALSLPEKSLMLFSARPSDGTDFELWATDGTAEGTRLVKDVNPEGSSNPRRMITFGGKLYFFADTPQGRELWRSDGTPEGTERVHGFPKNDPETLDLVQAGNALFILQGTEPGVEVWRSDGTEAGTERVLHLPELFYYRNQATGRHLFLVVRDGLENYEMWAAGGTGEAARIFQAGANPHIKLLAVGDHLAFSLEDDHGHEPWWSDGTPEGTHRIADICPGPCSSFGVTSSFAGTYGGRAVIRADDGVSGTEPWLTDGTAAGTWRLGDLCPGECSSFGVVQTEINGWLVLQLEGGIWLTDGTPDGAWNIGHVDDTLVDWIPLPGRLVIAHTRFQMGFLSVLPVTAPAPPPGAWLESPRQPGFRFKVQIGQVTGRQEPACMARTLCVSGAAPGRSEVFLRVSEPRPDGRLWPSLIKLTTAAVDVWVVQTETGYLRHYRLNASGPAGSTLPGILDREGFLSVPGVPEPAAVEAEAGSDPKPPGRWIESKTVPGFRVQARLTANGKKQILRKEACTVAETFCLSGATPGLAELLVRVTGPKPNKYFWPMLARFTPATLEVWIQQQKTGNIRYYRLNAPPAGSSKLDGYFDRLGFKR